MSGLCGFCLRTSQAGCAGSENPSGLVAEVLVDRVSENYNPPNWGTPPSARVAGSYTSVHQHTLPTLSATAYRQTRRIGTRVRRAARLRSAPFPRRNRFCRSPGALFGAAAVDANDDHRTAGSAAAVAAAAAPAYVVPAPEIATATSATRSWSRGGPARRRFRRSPDRRERSLRKRTRCGLPPNHQSAIRAFPVTMGPDWRSVSERTARTKSRRSGL
jgi:hypothetical protein